MYVVAVNGQLKLYAGGHENCTLMDNGFAPSRVLCSRYGVQIEMGDLTFKPTAGIALPSFQIGTLCLSGTKI